MVFANLPSRIKAVTIDSLLLIVVMYALSLIFNDLGIVSNEIKIGCVVLILLYEPLFVSFYGGTIGHFYSKIEVKSEADTTKRLALWKAVLRYIIKLTLGWISLLTVTAGSRKQAIHDVVAKSLVLEVA